ncbi:MAG TPA: M48 family metalloprotease [Solirubrobacteraceae bacterium]|nr:M48 family metalloprotease [Solirubrobacteraceae bacterium]
MSRSDRHRVGFALGLALLAAEGARRLLTPRTPPLTPAAVDLRDHFSAEEIVRGRRYARPQRALAVAVTGVDVTCLIALVRRPPRVLRETGARPVAQGALAGAVLSAALTLPTLPIAAVMRRRAMAAGLDTQGWPGWARDRGLATAISSAFAAAAGAGVVAATRRWPRGWWLPAAAGSVIAGAALAALAPVVLAPLFNDFVPLPEGETRTDVLALAQAAGVTVGEVYSVDASRRTSAANAYVTGLGPTKRVVLYDTLLDRYSRDEIRMVVAHELAHVRFRDVPRNVAFAALIAPGAALAIQRVSWALSPQRGTAAALPALALAAGLVSAPLGLAGSRLSRAVERRADEYSLDLGTADGAFISFERAIALQNLADLAPPRWARLTASHPPTDERIGAAVAWGRRRRAGGDA